MRVHRAMKAIIEMQVIEIEFCRRELCIPLHSPILRYINFLILVFKLTMIFLHLFRTCGLTPFKEGETSVEFALHEGRYTSYWSFDTLK